jgi:hypothetical protein
MHPTAKTGEGKLSDYHVCLEHILSGLVRLQAKKPQLFPIQIGENPIVYVRLIFFVAWLCGDIEGADKACGKKGSRSHLSTYLCRRCSVKFQDLANPKAKWKHWQLTKQVRGDPKYRKEDNPYKETGTRSKEYKKHAENRAKLRLHVGKNGFYLLSHGCAYDALDFGTDPHNEPKFMASNSITRHDTAYMAHGCILNRTPYDVLHAYHGGYQKTGVLQFRVIPKELLRFTKWEEADSKKGKKDKGVEDHLPLPPTGENNDSDIEEAKLAAEKEKSEDAKAKEAKQSRRKVFSPKYKRTAEEAMLYSGLFLKNQSSPNNLPRTYFPQGALSTEKLNLHEFNGLILLDLVLLCSTLGHCWFYDPDPEKDKEQYKKHRWLGNDRSDCWVAVMDDLLLVDSIFNREAGSREWEIRLLEEYIPHFQERYKTTVNRLDGCGHNTPKFHQIMHACEDMRAAGGLDNVNGQGLERLLVDVKAAGSKTRMDSATLDQQTALRSGENMIVHTALMSLRGPHGTTSRSKRAGCFLDRPPTLDPSISAEVKHHGCTFLLTPQGIMKNPQRKDRSNLVPALWKLTSNYLHTQQQVTDVLLKDLLLLDKCGLEELEMPNYVTTGGGLPFGQDQTGFLKAGCGWAGMIGPTSHVGIQLCLLKFKSRRNRGRDQRLLKRFTLLLGGSGVLLANHRKLAGFPPNRG